MRIAIVSDSHGKKETVKHVLEQIDDVGADCILHCGDIDDPDTVYLFPANTHFVYGNCDHDRNLIRDAAKVVGAEVHEPYGELEVGGKKIAFIHSDDARLFQQLQASDRYDFLFYGHTHVAAEHASGRTRVINPGALHRARPKSFAVLELPSGKLKRLTLDE